MSGTSPIAAAIDQLLLERSNLVARLAKVDAAIASMRELFHLPADRPATKARNTKVPDPEHRDSRGGQVREAIVAALKRGALTTVEIARTLRVDKSNAGYHLRQLKSDGVVVFIGAGRATKVALAGSPASQEEP